MPTLVLGTHNRKKGIELAELVAPLGLTARTLAEYPQAIEVIEDGDSFAANARLKAIQQAKHLQEWVLGEDSGLCVAALGGAPGIYSARYSGEDATDEANNAKLLAELGTTPLAKRGAYYVCYAVLSSPTGEIAFEVEGRCHGRILFEGRGTNGFGYDPLFEIVEYHRTFAEFGLRVKAALSHRARAARRIIPQLMQLFDTQRI